MPDWDRTGIVEITGASDGSHAHVHMLFPARFVCMEAGTAHQFALDVLKAVTNARAAHAVSVIGKRFGLTKTEGAELFRQLAR
jgi:hypothetical protein